MYTSPKRCLRFCINVTMGQGWKLGFVGAHRRTRTPQNEMQSTRWRRAQTAHGDRPETHDRLSALPEAFGLTPRRSRCQAGVGPRNSLRRMVSDNVPSPSRISYVESRSISWASVSLSIPRRTEDLVWHGRTTTQSCMLNANRCLSGHGTPNTQQPNL